MAWTSPRTWVAAEVVTAALLNTHVRDNLKAIGDPWTAYTPTWTSSGTAPALGNGTSVGAYVAAGKLIHFRFLLTMGSTTTFGTSGYRFSLPVTAATVTFANQAIHSTVHLTDTGGSSWPSQVRLVTASTMELLCPAGTGDVRFAIVTNVAPFTWGNTDTISVAGTYEAA
jgi:hypothetical protein